MRWRGTLAGYTAGAVQYANAPHQEMDDALYQMMYDLEKNVAG